MPDNVLIACHSLNSSCPFCGDSIVRSRICALMRNDPGMVTVYGERITEKFRGEVI